MNSSLNRSALDQVKSDVLAGRTKLLYVAPDGVTISVRNIAVSVLLSMR